MGKEEEIGEADREESDMKGREESKDKRGCGQQWRREERGRKKRKEDMEREGVIGKEVVCICQSKIC